MEQLAALANRKKGTTRLNRNSKLFKTIIRAMQDKKGEHLVSLDLRKIHEAVADYFIICEATNQPQLRAIADAVEDAAKKDCGETVYHHEGRQAAQWILLDYVNIVVHLMLPEARRFYKLEEMWSDAVVDEHND